jgi:hypothetical protein
MNSILNGKRRVTATVLKAFGLRKVYVIDDYEVLNKRSSPQGMGTKEAGR